MSKQASLGENDLKLHEWNPSRLLVWFKGDAFLIPFTNLLLVKVFFTFSYRVDSKIKRTYNNVINYIHQAAFSGCMFNNVRLSSHSLCSISPCAHLLKRGSSKSSCLSTIWPRKDLNFAKIMRPSPEGVEVALQLRWFSQGRIHCWISSQPLSLPIFVSTFRISVKFKKK